jgi:hypothetical protein
LGSVDLSGTGSWLLNEEIRLIWFSLYVISEWSRKTKFGFPAVPWTPTKYKSGFRLFFSGRKLFNKKRKYENSDGGIESMRECTLVHRNTRRRRI